MYKNVCESFYFSIKSEDWLKAIKMVSRMKNWVHLNKRFVSSFESKRSASTV